MGYHYDEKTDIQTGYYFDLEGIQVKFDNSWCPGATCLLYRRGWNGRVLLYTMEDCPKELLWTPSEPMSFRAYSLENGVKIGYWADGYMRGEMLVNEEEADEIASRAVYDEQNLAQIAVTRTLSIGTSIVWIKVKRDREYSRFLYIDVPFCLEFANREECTRFLHEDITKLEHRSISRKDSDVGFIDEIMRALSSKHDDHISARSKAAQCRIPHSQFADEYEYSQRETEPIRRRASNRDDDQLCFLNLHLSTNGLYLITRVDWSATTILPTFPSSSGTFQSLNDLHLKFPSHTSQDRNSSDQGDLTITISAREISFSTGTDSVSLGNGFTLSSTHRTINVNYINAIMGDAFLGTINGGNNGGRNNVLNSFSLRTDEAANTWRAVPSEPTPEQKGISTLVRRFVRSIRFGPPHATDDKLHGSC